MSNTKDKVKDLIERVPSLRDSDTRLTSHIWFRELEKMGLDPFEMKATDFFKMYAQEKMTLGPTIKRARAKLQEESPNLRGKKYFIRKGVAQDKWLDKLGYKPKYL
tara:strand:+ start:117 stop:434 length:318 start_codon:yes stop_codon:yes gene_type:complete